jgi:hypothetical protein
LSHGRLVGNWPITRRQPPSRVTRRLGVLTQVRPSRLICQEAVSQTMKSACGQPFEQAGRDRTDGASVHKASPHGLRVRTPHTVTGERCGLRIMRIGGELPQAQRRASCPGVQVRVGQGAPPHVIGES